jgi:sugar phosphate isomerase/epimerase
MQKIHQVNRRSFLQQSVLYSAATIAAVKSNTLFANHIAASSTPAPTSANADIKVGSVSWNFHALSRAGESPVNSIELLGEMGFDGVELIIGVPQDLKDLWTDRLIGNVRRLLDKYKMEVPQMAMFQLVVQDLSNLDYDKRMRALDHFEAGIIIAKKLGTKIVNIVAPWARELRDPSNGYLPRYYEVMNPKENEKYAIIMDPSFDWDTVWQQFVATTKDCLERVKKHNMLFSIENHTNTVIADAASFLLLCQAIPDKALGYNLDAGWTQIQREYPPVAISKVKDRLLNLHMRDIDGAMRQFIPIGEGVMDFAGIIRELKKTGYKGYISIEQDGPGDMKVICKRYLELMRKLIAEV